MYHFQCRLVECPVMLDWRQNINCLDHIAYLFKYFGNLRRSNAHRCEDQLFECLCQFMSTSSVQDTDKFDIKPGVTLHHWFAREWVNFVVGPGIASYGLVYITHFLSYSLTPPINRRATKVSKCRVFIAIISIWIACNPLDEIDHVDPISVSEMCSKSLIKQLLLPWIFTKEVLIL